MAQQQSMPNNNNNADNNNGGASKQQQQQQQQQHQQHLNNQRLQQQLEVNKSLNDKTEPYLPNPIFHDFFGGTNVNIIINKPNQNDSSAVVLGPNSPSASFAASSARGPISSTSDLASERRVGNHLEGVPFYGPRSDISGPEMSNKIAGTKRCKSDSTFMGSSRDGIPQIGPEPLEGSHLMKLLRNGALVERPKRSNDDEATYGPHQQMRPTSASLVFQPPPGVSKLDRLIPVNVGPTGQYPPRGGHLVPFVPHVLSNRFREANAGPGPPNISQSAADEGSRTGIMGPGILTSVSGSERNVSGSVPVPSSGRQKGATGNTEPESSALPSGQRGASRQMTIFYGGQAHVFDDVHPNKADVIMALAGSNGGSWSTSFSPRSTAGESQLLGGESELGNANNAALLRDHRGKLSFPGTSSQGLGFGDQISLPAGGHPIGKVTKETRNSVQAMEHISKAKNEL